LDASKYDLSKKSWFAFLTVALCAKTDCAQIKVKSSMNMLAVFFILKEPWRFIKTFLFFDFIDVKKQQ
jgi:hypothetical protein